LINPNAWVLGSFDSQPNFSAVGQGGENQIIEKDTPRGNSGVVWATLGNDVASDADGGWGGIDVSIDRAKKYRLSVWIRREDVGNGRTYF
jgi:hypothetical protein